MTRCPPRLERGGDVLHAERLDAEERAEAEAFVAGNRTQEQDVHRDMTATAAPYWRAPSDESQAAECSTRPAGILRLRSRIDPGVPTLMFNIVVWARRRRVVVVGGVVCALGVSIAGITRLSFDTDVLSLLPQRRPGHPGVPGVPRARRQPRSAVRRLHGARGARDRRLRGRDRRMDRARCAPRRRSSASTPAPSDRRATSAGSPIARLLLLRGRRLDEALRRLQPDGIRARRCAEPRAADGAVARGRRHGPLGSGRPARACCATRWAPRSRAQHRRDRRTATCRADDRSRLVIARPRRPPYDSDVLACARRATPPDRAATVDQSSAPADAEDEPRPPLSVEFAGGHRIAVETEAIVQRESILNTVGSLALILPLLYLTYRSLWLVAVGAAALRPVAGHRPWRARLHRRQAVGGRHRRGGDALRPRRRRRRAALRRLPAARGATATETDAARG